MADRYFPRLEYLKDSLGNTVTRDRIQPGRKMYIRVGCSVEFVAKAFDPLGEPIRYHFSVSGAGRIVFRSGWQSGTDWTWSVAESQVGQATAYCRVRSPRPYHLQTAYDEGHVGDVLTYDDLLTIDYVVLPADAAPGSMPDAA